MHSVNMNLKTASCNPLLVQSTKAGQWALQAWGANWLITIAFVEHAT